MTNDKNPGANGKQQGEKKDRAPAATAIGAATSIGPDITTSLTESTNDTEPPLNTHCCATSDDSR